LKFGAKNPAFGNTQTVMGNLKAFKIIIISLAVVGTWLMIDQLTSNSMMVSL